MTCDCKATFTAKFLERAKELYPDSKDHSVELKNYAFVFNKEGGMDLRGYIPVELTHIVTNKKTGATRSKKEKTSLLFSYCPICGVKQNQAEESK